MVTKLTKSGLCRYHEKGSLCDFLKANVLSWHQLCRIAYSMASGLAHLHEELPPKVWSDQNK